MIVHDYSVMIHVVMLCLVIAFLTAYHVWRKKVFLVVGFFLAAWLLLGPALIGIVYCGRALVDHPIVSLGVSCAAYFSSLFAIERTKRVNDVAARHALSVVVAFVLCSVLAFWCLRSLNLLARFNMVEGFSGDDVGPKPR